MSEKELPHELPKRFSLEHLILPNGIWLLAGGTAFIMVIAAWNALMNSQ